MKEPFAYLPIPDEEENRQIQALVAEYERGLAGCPDDQIDRMMGAMALLYPAEKALSEDAQDGRLALYRKMLRDLPFDVLSRAFEHCGKTCNFFPKVAEIRKEAERLLSDRKAKLAALNILAMKHRLEWSPPITPEDATIDPAEVDEANRLMKRMGARTRYRDDGTPYQLERGMGDPAFADEDEAA